MYSPASVRDYGEWENLFLDKWISKRLNFPFIHKLVIEFGMFLWGLEHRKYQNYKL
jgi:hypothetical protein